MDLFEVLSNDERIIVFSSEEDSCFYTWNQSATLQCWQPKTKAMGPLLMDTGGWEVSGVKTLEDEPRNFEEARKAARNWYFGDSGEVVKTSDHESHGGPNRVVIDRPATSEETAKLFGISKKRQNHLDKMVKKILNDEKKTKRKSKP
jgi:hypothetical protein